MLTGGPKAFHQLIARSCCLWVSCWLLLLARSIPEDVPVWCVVVVVRTLSGWGKHSIYYNRNGGGGASCNVVSFFLGGGALCHLFLHMQGQKMPLFL